MDAIVSHLTPIVNTLTVPSCKFPDMRLTSLADRAKFSRMRAGYERELDAAKAIGCSRTLVIAWENGDAKSIGPKYLFNAAKAYGVTPEWLSSGEGPDPYEIKSAENESHEVLRPETPDNYIRFPLLDGFAGMGRGDYVGDYPEIVNFVEVTREWASQKLHGVPPDVIRVITGRGDSMRGQYSDGDLVFLDSRIKRFDADSAYCYRWNGQVQIKRLQLIGPGRVRILSKNPDYPPIDVGIEDLEIGGRAIAAWTLKEF